MPEPRARWGTCEHCGVRISEVPYGAGYRWTHRVKIAGVFVDGGTFCQLTEATPKRVTVTQEDEMETSP